ncbi:MAG: LCP family protein [Actinomycetes bacterium]
MNDWPEGWTRGNAPAGGPSDPGRTSAGGSGRTAPTAASGRAAPARPSAADEATRVLRRPPGREQPQPGARPPVPPPPGRRSGSAARFPRAGRDRLLRRTLLVLVLVLALLLGLVLFFFSRVGRVDALRDYAGRPAATPGQDWLIVGSDSREGLSDAQIKQLHLGKVGGRRTDTIILLHVPTSGPSTMVSLPRDSYVPIPGHGRNKLNAAYAFGGAPLLAQTVERVTGIRLDHYAELGFGGFVGMTDAVGGVQLCPKRNIRDKKSGLHVKKGCQQMDGGTALAYVRARYFDPRGDLGRVQRQQEFLGAIFAKASSPATLVNPFRLVALGNAGTTALTVDRRDGPIDLLRFAFAMKAISGGKGIKTTVPVADTNYRTSAGSAVLWDRAKALALFHSLR